MLRILPRSEPIANRNRYPPVLATLVFALSMSALAQEPSPWNSIIGMPPPPGSGAAASLHIYLNSTSHDVTSKMTTVALGEEIQLWCGQSPKAATGPVMWLPPTGRIVGGWTVTETTAAVVPLKLDISPTTFYWTDEGTWQMICTSNSSVAETTFNVQGPSYNKLNVVGNMSSPHGQVYVYQPPDEKGWALSLGNITSPTTTRISFAATVDGVNYPQPGKLTWVQVVTESQVNVESVSATVTLCAIPPNKQWLDTEYPYAVGVTTLSDTPDINLASWGTAPTEPPEPAIA